MQVISSQATTRRQNSATCLAIEYEFEGEKDINTAVIELTGRYPEVGSAMNTVCKEQIYIAEGSGTITTADGTIELRKGDMILIQPNDTYFFDGTMTLLISSSPAWYPGQYRGVAS